MPKQAERVNVEVYLEDVRISHPHLFEAQQYKKDKNSKPRFTAGFILDKKKNRKTIEEIEDAIERIRDEMFDGRKIKADNICLSDGDDTDKDEFQGAMVLRAASPENKPPEVLGRDKRPLSKRDGKPYGGCYVNAIVRIYGYDAYADQVNCSLEAVQYFRKGPSFGAGPADTSKFGTYDDEDEEDFTSMRSSRKGRDDDEDEKPSRRSRSRDEDDEDEKPSRRSRSRDDDEDEAPRSRRRSRDDEDEDRDPPRRSRSRDDEDDDAPRSRRRSRDDD